MLCWLCVVVSVLSFECGNSVGGLVLLGCVVVMICIGDCVWSVSRCVSNVVFSCGWLVSIISILLVCGWVCCMVCMLVVSELFRLLC